jgi:Fe-S-cluster containining protein
MEREIDLKKITDGRFYTSNDMVKAGCGDCEGCSDCCRGMGESILLDPYDVYRMTEGLACTFDALLESCLELHVVDGVILPNMKMVGAGEQCPFLNGMGRCNIHGLRPGICRLFPLGRCYEDGGFRYFFQIYECKKEPKTKVKIKKWLDTPELKKYEAFIADWHYFQKNVQRILEDIGQDSFVKKINLYILEQFYRKAYESGLDFYKQFYERLGEAKRYVGIA